MASHLVVSIIGKTLKVPFRTELESVSQPISTISNQFFVDRSLSIASTYINKLLEILIKVREIILAPLVVRNELLLALQQLLALLLESLALRTFVLNACKHESVLIVVGTVGELFEEVFDGDERELLICVARFACDVNSLFMTFREVMRTPLSPKAGIYTYL